MKEGGISAGSVILCQANEIATGTDGDGSDVNLQLYTKVRFVAKIGSAENVTERKPNTKGEEDVRRGENKTQSDKVKCDALRKPKDEKREKKTENKIYKTDGDGGNGRFERNPNTKDIVVVVFCFVYLFKFFNF